MVSFSQCQDNCPSREGHWCDLLQNDEGPEKVLCKENHCPIYHFIEEHTESEYAEKNELRERISVLERSILDVCAGPCADIINHIVIPDNLPVPNCANYGPDCESGNCPYFKLCDSKEREMLEKLQSGEY